VQFRVRTALPPAMVEEAAEELSGVGLFSHEWLDAVLFWADEPSNNN
jgi:hypothetical protein